MVNVLQLNLNHCEVAQGPLLQLAQEDKPDVVMISEQYQDRRERKWFIRA